MYGTLVKINYFATGAQFIIESSFSEPNPFVAIEELEKLLDVSSEDLTVSNSSYQCIPDVYTNKAPADAESLWKKAAQYHKIQQFKIDNYCSYGMPPQNIWQIQCHGDKQEALKIVANLKKILKTKLNKNVNIVEYNF